MQELTNFFGWVVIFGLVVICPARFVIGLFITTTLGGSSTGNNSKKEIEVISAND